MEKVILSSNRFSRGVLEAKFMLQPHIVSSTELIDHVDFYEYQDGEYVKLSANDGNVTLIQANSYNADTEKQIPAKYVVDVTSNGAYTNHLIKAVIYMKHSDAITEGSLCCAVVQGEFFVFEEFFVDMTAYEKNLLASINLKCDDCNVSTGNINDLLKLFAVQAAAESHSMELEYIFGKITCGKAASVAPKRLTKNCNCNG